MVILFGRGVGNNMERDEPMEIAAAGSTTTPRLPTLAPLGFQAGFGAGPFGLQAPA